MEIRIPFYFDIFEMQYLTTLQFLLFITVVTSVKLLFFYPFDIYLGMALVFILLFYYYNVICANILLLLFNLDEYVSLMLLLAFRLYICLNIISLYKFFLNLFQTKFKFTLILHIYRSTQNSQIVKIKSIY